MKAHHLLKKNIDALLKARGRQRKDIAVYCRRSEAWLSQIFTNEDRNMPLKYLDRIADFFGLETYQLFQPGLIPDTDRRTGRERRSGLDRRQAGSADLLRPTLSRAELESKLSSLSPEAYKVFARRMAWAIAEAEPEAHATARRGRQEPDAPPTPRLSGPRAVRPR